MTKKKAIKILKGLIKENKNQNSLIKTRSYISDFFGKDSDEYLFVKEFEITFTEYVVVNPITKTQTRPYNQQEKQNIFQNKEIKLNEFLNNCIETIENKGLLKKTKKNLLSDLSNLKIITMLFTVLVSGIYLGIRLSENKIIKELFLTITNQQ